MRRFAALLIDRLQATRLQLLDVYGHAARRLSRAAARARWCPRRSRWRPSARRPPTPGRSSSQPPGEGGPRASRRASSRCSPPSAPARCRSRSAATPAGAGPLVHTVRAVGLATRGDLRARAPARCSACAGPFGRPWPVAEIEGGDVIVVAGGIGLAPLRPAILALLARRERYGRLRAALRRPLARAAALHGRAGASGARAGSTWRSRVDTRRARVARPRRRRAAPGRAAPSFDAERAAALRLRTRGDDALHRRRARAGRRRRRERVYASMERNMQCGIGHCGHCQLGPTLVCRDGPVYRWSELEPWLAIREL